MTPLSVSGDTVVAPTTEIADFRQLVRLNVLTPAFGEFSGRDRAGQEGHVALPTNKNEDPRAEPDHCS